MAAESTKSEIGEWIGFSVRERREALCLSQQQLADAVGLMRTSITNIEKGRQVTTIEHLYALGAALQCDPRELLPDPSLISNGAGEFIKGVTIDRLQKEAAELEKKLTEVNNLIEEISD